MCYRCFWPKAHCWCGSLVAMPTRTRFVFLMHPKEYKEEKAATGRLTRLCLANSELHMGKGFDEDPAVQSLLADPANGCVLLYPGPTAVNLSTLPAALAPAAGAGKLASLPPALRPTPGASRLVVFVLDATWSLARKMLRLSPSLQRLPRIVISPSAPSRYLIKQQPHPGCLSTLESVHELLLALERAGLDEYPLPRQLLDLFDRMQDFQIRCASDPDRPGYRRQPYKAPAERRGPQGNSRRRLRFLRSTEPNPPSPA